MFTDSTDKVIGAAQRAALENLTLAFDEGNPKQTAIFIGPSGVGKTMVASLLATHVGSELQQINCASDTGINAAREAIGNLALVPFGSALNFLFLDEIHGLSKPAQNAWLVPLQKLPSKTFVYAATSEPDKVIPTLLSRFSKYYFKPPTTAEISRLIHHHLLEHNIAIDTAAVKPETPHKTIPGEAIKDILRRSGGNVRDVLDYLTQLIAGNYVEYQVDEKTVTLASGLIAGKLTVQDAFKLAAKVEDPIREARGICAYCIKVLTGSNNRRARQALLEFAKVNNEIELYVAILNTLQNN